MKHYWWVLPLIAAALFMYPNLSYSAYFITSIFIVSTLVFLYDSVQKGTRDKIMGVDWSKDKHP